MSLRVFSSRPRAYTSRATLLQVAEGEEEEGREAGKKGESGPICLSTRAGAQFAGKLWPRITHFSIHSRPTQALVQDWGIKTVQFMQTYLSHVFLQLHGTGTNHPVEADTVHRHVKLCCFVWYVSARMYSTTSRQSSLS